MAVLLSMDESHKVLHARFLGAISDEEAMRLYARFAAWFSDHGYYSTIMDFSGVSSFTVSVAMVRELAAKAPLLPDGFCRIMVAPSDNVFGCARMYEMLGSDTRDSVHVVRTIEEACKLLEIESLRLEAVSEL